MQYGAFHIQCLIMLILVFEVVSDVRESPIGCEQRIDDSSIKTPVPNFNPALKCECLHIFQMLNNFWNIYL